MRLVRQKGKWNTKDIYIFRVKQPRLRIDFIGCPSQPPANDLFTEQLAGEGTQPHYMSDGLGIPTLGEHAHGNDVLDLFPRPASFADGINSISEALRNFLLGEFPARLCSLFAVFRSAPADVVCSCGQPSTGSD